MKQGGTAWQLMLVGGYVCVSSCCMVVSRVTESRLLHRLHGPVDFIASSSHLVTASELCQLAHSG